MTSSEMQTSAFVERRESENILKLPRSFSLPEWLAKSAADATAGMWRGLSVGRKP